MRWCPRASKASMTFCAAACRKAAWCWFPERPAPARPPLAMQFLLQGRSRGRALPVCHAVGNPARDRQGGPQPRLGPLEAAREGTRFRRSAASPTSAQLTVFNPSEVELGETTEAMIAGIERHPPAARGARLAVRAAADRPERPALSPPGAGAEAVLRRPRRAPCCCWTTRPAAPRTTTCRALPMAWWCWSSWPTSSAPSGGGCACSKMRGVPFRGGYHDFAHPSRRPRCLSAAGRRGACGELRGSRPDHRQCTSSTCCWAAGSPVGTSTLLLGPAGTGKSTLATQFAVAAAARGERAAIFAFDENAGTFRSRSRKLGMDVDTALAERRISLQQVDPAETVLGRVRRHRAPRCQGTDAAGVPAKMIIIDSLNGYLNAMPEEKFLTAQLHELLSYLVAAGRGDHADGDAVRHGRQHGFARRHHLSGRQRHPAAVLRGRRHRPPRHLRREEAQRPA